MPPATPARAPISGRGAAPAATHAPVNPPVTIRAIRPPGAVRLGVLGSLSTTSSRTANTVKMATDGTEPIRARGRSILSRPRWTAHAVTAGAVIERSPANSPIRKGSSPLLSTSISLGLNLSCFAKFCWCGLWQRKKNAPFGRGDARRGRVVTTLPELVATIWRQSIVGLPSVARHSLSRPALAEAAAGNLRLEPGANGWWRRRESNPRPKVRRRRTLHACPLRDFHARRVETAKYRQALASEHLAGTRRGAAGPPACLMAFDPQPPGEVKANVTA